jgi:hypothetical protein
MALQRSDYGPYRDKTGPYRDQNMVLTGIRIWSLQTGFQVAAEVGPPFFKGYRPNLGPFQFLDQWICLYTSPHSNKLIVYIC